MSEISWGTSAYEKLYLVNDEEVINLSQAKSLLFFQILYCVLENSVSSLSQTKNRKPKWIGLRLTQYRELDGIDGEPMEFEWMIFPGFITLQILHEIKNLWKPWSCNAEQFQGRIIFM